MHRTTFVGLALMCFACAGAAPATAPVVDPAARRILDRFAAHVTRLERFEIAVTSKAEAQVPGQAPEAPDEEPPGVVTFERPARYSVTAGGKPFIVSDGRTVTVVDPDAAAPVRYWQTVAPASPDQVLAAVAPVEMEGYLMLAVLAADPVEKLIAGAERVEYAGRAELDGVSYDKVRVIRPTRESEIWFPVAGDPLPRREVIDLSKMYANAAKAAGTPLPRIVMITDYTQWKSSDRPFENARFAFVPPPGAVAVPTKDALFQTEPPEAPWKATLNEPAPAFSLSDVDGKAVALADFKGQVVVLDFWATWCGPCVRGLPVVADVVRAHAKDGVTLLAVNVREDADKIRAFLARTPVDARVLRDADGAVSRAYKVGGIPHTVVISPDGRVHSVKVGFGDGSRAEMEAAIKEALSIKSVP